MANTNTSYLQKVIDDNKEKPYKRNNSKVSDVSKNFQAQTLYVGAKSRNTKENLRIYDKKEEQISRSKTHGCRSKEKKNKVTFTYLRKKRGTTIMKHMRHIAKEVDDWTRVEAEFSGDYAHQLTDAIKECNSDEQLKNIIISSILDRYM